MRSCWVNEGIEGTYDAVGRLEVRGRGMWKQLERFGWCKLGSVRYADVLG